MYIYRDWRRGYGVLVGKSLVLQFFSTMSTSNTLFLWFVVRNEFYLKFRACHCIIYCIIIIIVCDFCSKLCNFTQYCSL